MTEEEKVHKKRRFPKKVLLVVSIILALALLVASVYFYLQYQKSQNILKNPTLAAQVEAQTLVGAVGQLIELPKNEIPTIATVSDVNKLKDQSFFKNAKNGFKLLIYPKAQKAILYDPVNKKIVEVGPINLGAQASSISPAQPLKVVLYNGTTTVGLTTTIEKQLKDKGANIAVVSKANASKSDYTRTIVIDLTGKQASAAKELAKLLGGAIASLPVGETKPTNAQILVILGK